MRDTERGRDRQRERQAPCRESDVGLDPGTPGPCPGPKAGTKPLSHPGIPSCFFFLRFYLFIHERHRERQRQEKQTPCKEPNMGLDHWTLGSRPEPKADAQQLIHPGVPVERFLIASILLQVSDYSKNFFCWFWLLS